MVFEAIVKLIVEHKGCDPQTITLDDTFESLDIDSLDALELVMQLEEELGVELNVEDKLETVGDLVDFVEGVMEK